MQTPDCCSLHPPNVLSAFCEECEGFICILCKIEDHALHTVLTLSDKHKQLEKELKTLKRNNSEKSILKKLNALINDRKTLKKDAEDVKEKIRFQHNSVKQWLSEIYEHQIDAINNALNDELKRFNTEENKLKDLKENRKSLKQLLPPSNSRNLINQCEDFMSAKKKLSTKMDGIWRKPKFIEPRKETFGPSEEMFAFLEIHILGYCVFQSKDNTKLGDSECSFLSTFRKSMRSHSLIEIPALNWQNTQLDYPTIGTIIKPSFTDNVRESYQAPDMEQMEVKKGGNMVCNFTIFLYILITGRVWLIQTRLIRSST